jgi:hypothetical protein
VIGVIYQHPVACAVALIAAFYGVAIAAYCWPFDRGENHDDRRHRDLA